MHDTLDPDGRYARKAVQLIEAEKGRLALAIARQVRTMVPRYTDIDMTAQARNNETVLSLVGDLIVRKKTGRLSEFVETMVQLRAASGFSVSDFLVGSMCFLPVLRRFLIHRAGNTSEGLIMFELIEAAAIPFTGRTAEIFVECGTDSTNPEGFDRHRFLSLLSDSLEPSAPTLKGISIVSVDDEFEPFADEDGDPTAPGFR